VGTPKGGAQRMQFGPQQRIERTLLLGDLHRRAEHRLRLPRLSPPRQRLRQVNEEMYVARPRSQRLTQQLLVPPILFLDDRSILVPVMVHLRGELRPADTRLRQTAHDLLVDLPAEA